MSNPWSAGPRKHINLGGMRSVLQTARTLGYREVNVSGVGGHLGSPKGSAEGERASHRYHCLPPGNGITATTASLQAIELMDQNSALSAQVRQVCNELQTRSLESQTKDVTRVECLSESKRVLNSVTDRLASIIQNKDLLKQQVGRDLLHDRSVVDARFQRRFVQLVQSMCGTVDGITDFLDAINWVCSWDVEQNNPVAVLHELSSLIAQHKVFVNAIGDTRTCVTQLQSRCE